MTNATKKKDEDEAFKTSLVDDVFGKDSQGRVQMEKVTMLIWQFRDDPDVVNFMARFVLNFAGSKQVFDGIEFYLPQLAHMLIHLEADWDDAVLERFALVISQQSLHIALQLNWILQGALEDYQPETFSGEPNPSHNPLFYTRCLKLMSNIERCVVYGKPRSHELQRLYERGSISKNEYEILERADRRFNAVQIMASDGTHEPGDNPSFGGTLLYKRKVRTSCFKPKPWKSRYFTIDDRMLYCFNNDTSERKLVRAMPLEGAQVSELSSGKYQFMFQVINRGFHFVLRAENAASKSQWVDNLIEESNQQALFERSHILRDLTPGQLSRYEFFKDERDFVGNLCRLAEDLRFKEPAERKILAPQYMKDLPVPSCCYLPLCNSTDIWRRVDKTLPKDTKVFNTNERCPVIMNFISKRGEKMASSRGGIKDVNLDVAEYIHLNYDMRDMEVIEEDDHEDKMITPNSSAGDLQQMDVEATYGEKKDDAIDEDQASASARSNVWKEEVTEELPVPSTPSNRNITGKGNKMLQRFVFKNNVGKVPSQVANRLQSHRSIRKRTPRKTSKMSVESPLPMTPVPIVEDSHSHDSDSESVVSVRSSSIMTTKGAITFGSLDEGGISSAAIEKAKAFVCHGETYAEKTARMLEEDKADTIVSENGLGEDPTDVQNEVVSVMAKSNDDLRQEVFVMQMIHYYKSVFANANLPLWLKTYRILSTSSTEGLIEVLTDATSIDGLKKSDGYPTERGLRGYFETVYGDPDSRSFQAAQTNFMQSLAAYSVVSYLLGLKDRHNGNIMIDTRGHLIFIDFGFAMGMAPGHEFSMERAPFKLTKEYVDVMGGVNSKCFAEFKRLFVEGMKQARLNSQIALGLVEIMMYKSNYPCFTGTRYGHGVAFKKFEKRLMLHVPDNLVERKALALITKSMEHLGTKLYDVFQQHSNGYAK